MAIVVDIDLEAGSLAEFDSITPTASPDILASANAALGYSEYGMQVYIDDTTTRYGQIAFSPGATDFRARFYVDPNMLTMGTSSSFTICQFGSTGAILIYVVLVWTGATYQIRLRTIKDDDSAVNTTVAITDAPHCIEVHSLRGAGTGEHKLWIDGSLEATQSSLDNDTKFDATDTCRIGALYLSSGTSGYLYLDELVIRDDATEIGENATTTSTTAAGTTTTTVASTTLTGSGSTSTNTVSSTDTTTTTTATTTAATTTAATTSAAPTTIQLRDGPGGHTARASVGDNIVLRSLNGTTLRETWAEVLSVTDPGGGATYYEYSVERKSGDAVEYPEGVTAVVYGPSGSGIIRVIGEE